jgi:class 3 adenylate cyclase
MPVGGPFEPKIINATILFIDLMNSVALSSSLSLWDYNKLINEFQETQRQVLDEIEELYPVGEFYLGGDQLAVFFYDPTQAVELERDEGAAQAVRNRTLYGALRMAVAVKNAWISHPRNLARLEGDQTVLDLSIGINSGNVVIERRGDGQARIEGFAINLAKRVQGYARYGRYCKIMLSKSAYDTYRGIVVQHVMLKQRAFFEVWTPQEGSLKGLPPGTEVHELKFFHRLSGFGIAPDSVGTYERIFQRDPTNLWAYTNLINYFLYNTEDHSRAREIAERALYSNPGNEKIYYDLAILYLQCKDYELARQYCRECLHLNTQMDIAYDLLSELEMLTNGDVGRALEHISRALALSPGCATYQINMAALLKRNGMEQAAQQHYDRAVELFPGIAQEDPDAASAFETQPQEQQRVRRDRKAIPTPEPSRPPRVKR